MISRLKITLAAVVVLALASCESIRDSYDNCGVWLEFVFDHNMEYDDSFEPQVRTVDVCLFDESGRFVKTIHAATGELDGRKRMFLNNLKFGEYRILTVGNLTEHFLFADRGGGDFVPGTTTIEQAVSALKHNGTVSHEFSHFYFGPAVEVNYKADLSVYRVPLIRQTNNFDIMLQTVVKGSGAPPQGPVAPVHTVEITAPESGAYDWLNNPISRATMHYLPHSSLSRLDYVKDGILQETAVKINTMRLLENEWDGYRITVRDIASGEELWRGDLLSLLEATKPDKRPDGTELPRSEYFDRECDWNIVIVYRQAQAPSDNAFVALRIYVNGWIVWQNGIGV